MQGSEYYLLQSPDPEERKKERWFPVLKFWLTLKIINKAKNIFLVKLKLFSTSIEKPQIFTFSQKHVCSPFSLKDSRAATQLIRHGSVS